MEKLVSIYQGKEARISTFDIFSGFGYKEHRAFKKVIWSHKSQFEEFGRLFESSTKDANNKKKGGQEKSYLLNEEQFTLLVALAKNTPESVELKMRVVREFFKMRSLLASLATQKSTLDYHTARQNGKQVYFQKTDVIKQFVDYATAQGSQSASLYYANIAKMENSALFLVEQKYPNLREVLNVRQLMQVATADQIVEKALQDGIEQELHYKDIYKLAKERVIQFSDIIGKSQVIALLEQDKQTSLEALK